MGRNNENSQFVCHACIGDVYLKGEIRSEREPHACMICGKKKRAIPFCDLCDRIHYILTSEFVRTDSEPSSWALYKELEIDWKREGENLYDILDEMLECGESLIEAVKKELSSRYYSYDEMVSGEEDPYGDEVHYRLQEPEDYQFCSTWSDFEREIRTRNRFFNSKAESLLNKIFSSLDCFQAHAKPLIRETGPGTGTEFLYRARCASYRAEIARILEHPACELGAPPSRLAASGRMNPQWISMFYGALDPETSVAEVRPPTGSFVIVGKFTIVRDLRLLDIGAFQHLFVKSERQSFFDPEFGQLRDKVRFLKRLVDIMSRPVLPSDEDYHYLPIQAVAEYLSEKMGFRLDGLVFPSSQRGGKGENVVLFRHASSVEPDGSGKMGMEVIIERPWYDEKDEKNEDFSILLSRKKMGKIKKKRQKEFQNDKEFPDPNGIQAWCTDIEEYPDEKPALRVDLDSLEVRHIQAVEYETRMHHVQLDLERYD